MFKFILLFSVIYHCGANDTPIIGILTQENPSYDNVDSYIAASDLKFLESAGARVIPVWPNQQYDYYERVVNYTNGILFPDGKADFNTPGGFGETAWQIYHLAKISNDKGRFFPIWGTCLGLEVFPFVELSRDLRVNCSVRNGGYSLNFTEDFARSKLFANLPNDIFNILLKENVSYNYQEYCLTESTMIDFGLDSEWHILTTNKDTKGLEFISTMENIKYPFYGVQYHPQINSFEFKMNEEFPHSANSIKVTQYFSNFFVSETRKNQNTFPNKELELKSLIYNWCPEFSGLKNDYFYQIYKFNKNDYKNILI